MFDELCSLRTAVIMGPGSEAGTTMWEATRTTAAKPRILQACTYPLTAAGGVKRIYTNLAGIDVTPRGLLVIEMIPGMTLEKLRTLTEPKLRLASTWQALAPPEARTA
jgi:acyl CoA:acetate/3-ketoacid CoA transferase beta subunit